MKRGLLIGVAMLSLCAAAKGMLPWMVHRRGVTNEQIERILERHPTAVLRISAEDWRGMRYQLTRFENMTNYVEQIGSTQDCARVLLRLHDMGEELSRSNSALRVEVKDAVKAVEEWKGTADAWKKEAEENADAAKVTKDIRKAVKKAKKNLSKVVKAIEQAEKKAESDEERELYALLIEILEGKES